jgi:tRNA(Arg) A34 adenosine deaminase TadA
MPPSSSIVIDLPPWALEEAASGRILASDDEKMAFVNNLARQNADRATGGPFAAAIFEVPSGRLVAAGVNSVVRLNNCTLHAEMIAIQLATQRVGSYALPSHELITSCDPCAMCRGAVLWSGVARLVCGALREDALRIGFDEGPVFAESWRYLAARGVEIVHGVRRDESSKILERYREQGPIYNA